MQTFAMLIGVSGSGKSTIANKLIKENKNAILLSSDNIRAVVYGDINDQTHNKEVFKAMEEGSIMALKDGHDVIYDATNLCGKRRKALLQKLPQCRKRAIVVATWHETCIKNDSKRSRSVGENIILNQLKQFQFPLESEGFDDIEIMYNKHEYVKEIYNVVLDSRLDASQDNKYHKLSAREHMTFAESLYSAESEFINDEYYSEVSYGLLLHDLGKIYTKTFKNTKGETTDEAHYYSHENVGAYISMFVDYDENTDRHSVIRIVNYHMMSHDFSEKNKQKNIDKFGEELYNMLVIHSKYDRMAH